MRTPWQETPIHLIDFEGGPYGVIEYGVASLHRGAVVCCHTRLCRASDQIPDRDTWQHGLRRQDTEAFPPMSEDWALFNGLRQTGLFAAHHASVENRFLKDTWPYPSEAPDFSHPGTKLAEWGPWLDTRTIYEQLYPGLDSYKLGDLVKTLGLQQMLDTLAGQHCPDGRRRYHCALYDALAAACLLLDLGRLPGHATLSLAQLCHPNREGIQQLFF